MFAIFAMECSFLKEQDDSIFLFDTQEDAEKWAIEKLVSEGVVMVDGERYIVDGETHEDPQDALEAYRDNSSLLHFFHVYPAFDMRAEKPTKIDRLNAQADEELAS